MFLLLISLSSLSLITATHFTFDPTSRLTTPENWLNGEVPCKGDTIKFDNSQPVVAFIDHNVDVESIIFPDNGVIMFTDNGVDLGGDAHWQCDQKSTPGREAFFAPDETADTSFYNPNNWIPDGEFFLHMNQVPSEDDDVTISSLTSAQLYLDLPVTVNHFQYYKRDRMTTEDFNVLLRTMEGQFQLIIPRPWAVESDQGGVQRMVAVDPIKVRNRQIRSVREGRVNGNSKNETLSTICQYVQCTAPEDLLCISSFIPFGHCCPVCGAKIELIAWELDFELAKTKIKHTLEKLNVFSKVLVTAERKTTDELSSEYEIVLFSKGKDTTYDEDMFSSASQAIIEKLAISLITHNHKSILDFDIHVSRIDRTIKTMSKVIASLIYFTILIALIAGFVYQNLELRVSRQNLFNPVIKYRRQNDEVAIELEDVIVQDSDSSEVSGVPEVHEDVADVQMINPNFEEEDSEAYVPEGGDIELVEFKSRRDSEDVTPVVTEDSSEEEDVEDSGNLNPNFEEDVEAEAGDSESVVPVSEPMVTLAWLASEPVTQEFQAPEAIAPEPIAFEPMAPEPQAPESLTQEPLAPEPMAPAHSEDPSESRPTPPPGDIQLIDF